MPFRSLTSNFGLVAARSSLTKVNLPFASGAWTRPPAPYSRFSVAARPESRQITGFTVFSARGDVAFLWAESGAAHDSAAAHAISVISRAARGRRFTYGMTSSRFLWAKCAEWLRSA